MESPGLTVHADVAMSFKVPELEGLLQVRGFFQRFPEVTGRNYSISRGRTSVEPRVPTCSALAFHQRVSVC
jgi:hypothetical protein